MDPHLEWNGNLQGGALPDNDRSEGQAEQKYPRSGLCEDSPAGVSGSKVRAVSPGRSVQPTSPQHSSSSMVGPVVSPGRQAPPATPQLEANVKTDTGKQIDILVAIFGDAAGHPLEVFIENHTVNFKALVFNEALVKTAVMDDLALILDNAALQADVCYCFIVPKPTPMGGRKARHPDEDGYDEDVVLQAQLARLLPRLGGWRTAGVTTGRSSFTAGAEWTRPTSEGCGWRDWRCSLGAFGGPGATQALL